MRNPLAHHRSRRLARSQTRLRRLLFDPLEQRELLAAAPVPPAAGSSVFVGASLSPDHTLVVGGTTRGDDIWLQSAAGSVNVWLNGKRLGSYHPTRVVVYGQAGNDVIHADPKL